MAITPSPPPGPSQARSASIAGAASLQVERRQWRLWALAIIITLLLLAGMASFSFIFDSSDPSFSATLRDSIRGLVALVFLFDLYTIYQQIQIYRIRRQLIDREELFSLITENADDLISVVNIHGQRLYNSPAHQRALGYSDIELQGPSVLEQIHPEDRDLILRASQEAFQTGAPVRVEYRFRRKDGEWRILESTNSGVRNPEGAIEKLIVVTRDITERRHSEQMLRQREEQLRQARKMEAVGRLSGGIAHDCNNLLAVSIGYTEAMEMQVGTGDPLRKPITEILKATERAAGLTRQLLDFSRKKVSQPCALDLNSIVVDMSQMLQRLIGAPIILTTELERDLSKIKADQSQIEQMLVNLVVNARDAMPSGGNLKIETSNLDIDEQQAQALPFLRPGPHVVLKVSDTGIGMDAETLRHIFDPFFTTKDPGKGTGLGLSTVYAVVRQSEGVIGTHSEPGKGTTFTIYLPHYGEGIPPREQVATPRASYHGTDTILVVEDEDSLLNLTCDFLAESGYTAIPAHDGLEALEVCRSHREPIHLLLSDISMPKLGGISLVRQVAALRPDIRILLMTAYTKPETVAPDRLGVNADILLKPFSREVLLQKVREVLDRAELPVSS